MYMITKNELKDLLKKTVVTVNFKKKDDTMRKMICTLNEEYLPDTTTNEEQESKKTKKENPEAIAVWDLEKHSWRSFRIDSIINYETNQ